MHDRLLNRVDELLSSRVRLAIVAVLSVSEWATFNYLKERTGASDGNLSVHVRKLEEAGYVKVVKAFVGRMPQTRYRLTKKGRNALVNYVRFLGSLVGDAEKTS
jgi:DNA-binding HxlR family transcriptional regulator